MKLTILASLLFCLHAIAQVDKPPQEPPYTNSETEFDGSETIDLNLSDRSNLIPTSQPPAATTAAKKPPEKQVQPAPVKSKSLPQAQSDNEQTMIDAKPAKENSETTEFIHHPNAKKGLYLIDSKGVYHYKTTKLIQHKEAFSFRVGSVPIPKITGTLKSNESFDFGDVYGDQNLIQINLDYQKRLFKDNKQIFAEAGFGFYTASGRGYFYGQPKSSTQAPKERYTFFGVPANLGLSYRFQFADRQWLTPYISAGGMYYGFAEIRDDGKRSRFVGVPAAYGAAGALISITHWDKELQFRMDREYGISNLWLSFDVRAIASGSEDVDVTSNYFSAGVVVDY